MMHLMNKNNYFERFTLGIYRYKKNGHLLEASYTNLPNDSHFHGVVLISISPSGILLTDLKLESHDLRFFVLMEEVPTIKLILSNARSYYIT